ncbi:MAG: isochorismatase family protein [Patescibacteria group bacterium]
MSNLKSIQKLNNKDSSSELKDSIDTKLNNGIDIAALIIDMQVPFLADIKSSEKDELISSHVEMIRYLAHRNIRAIVLEYIGEGGTYWRLRREIKKIPRFKRIIKEYANGFLETGLNKQLKIWQIKEIILMGINASYCVKETAEGALDNGFSICTARQLVADREYQQDDFKKNVPEWYEKNGVYYNNLNHLRQGIEKKIERININ